MRSIVLLVVTLLMLAGGLAAFLYFQSTTTVHRADGTVTVRPEPPPTTQAEGEFVLGAGDGVWIETYDKDTGVLINDFRADRYEPPKDDIVHVTRPQARFYSGNGQVMTLTADFGDVTMPESNRRAKGLDSLDSGPPTRGILHNVTLGLLETKDAKTPSITCTIPILAFDNESLKLNTVQTQIDGREVLADRVPVTVRGDYDFDGQGLIVRYNQRDQRLEYLEITHGNRLIVNDPGAFGGLSTGDDEDDAKPLIALADTNPATAAKLAAEERDRRAARRAIATQRAAAAQSRGRAAVAYHAIFQDDVRVFEGSTEVGTADRLTTTFSFDKPDPTTQPAPAAPRLSSTQPTTKRARSAIASQPATTRTQQPIELRWTGKLTITPTSVADAGLRSPLDRLIGFEGNPAKLSRDGSGVIAKKIVVSTEGDRFTATAAPGEQVMLTDPSGLSLATESLDFVGDTATLTGPSSATMPLPTADARKGDATTKPAAPGVMNVRWSERANLSFASSPAGGRVIRRANFDGDVEVVHPDLGLRAASLGLTFGTSSTAQKPLLDRIDAAGNVDVLLRGEGAAERHLTGDKFVAQASADATGAVQINGIEVQGNVRLHDGPRVMTADLLSVRFAANTAATQPTDGPLTASIETLRAAGNVKLQDGPAHAAADELSLKTEGDHQSIRLKGTPAVVSDGASRLSGNTINVRSDGATAGVVGPGKFIGLMATKDKDGKAPSTQNTKNQPPPEPVEIAWSESFDYVAAANRADLVGDVAARALGSDGAVLSATGKRMRIDLADAAAKSAATQPATTQADSPLKGFGGKRVANVTLSDDVVLSSVLADPKNAQQFLRRVYAFAPEVRVALDEKGDPAGVTIPSGGRLLVDDPQPAAPGANGRQAKAIEGAIAVEWKQSMTYAPAEKTVTLDGGVTVVYQRVGQEKLTLQSGRMIADVNPTAGQRPVDRVRVDGGVTVSNKAVVMTATDGVYDPASNLLTVRGNNQQPVQLTRTGDASSTSFGEVVWNLQTNEPERLKDVKGSMRR